MKLYNQGQGGGRILDVAGQGLGGRGGGPENWTIFLDVICVSPVIEKSFLIDPLTTSNAICRDFN